MKFSGLTLEELRDMEILGFYSLKEWGGVWRGCDMDGYNRRLALWRGVKAEIRARLAGETVPKDSVPGA